MQVGCRRPKLWLRWHLCLTVSQRSILSKQLTLSQPHFQYPLNQNFRDWHSTLISKLLRATGTPHTAQKGQELWPENTLPNPGWNCTSPGCTSGFTCAWLLAEKWWMISLRMASGWTLATAIVFESSLVLSNCSSLWKASLSYQVNYRASISFVMLDNVCFSLFYFKKL